jgi:hypothetical protein
VVVAVLNAGADPPHPRGPQAVAHPSAKHATLTPSANGS